MLALPNNRTSSLNLLRNAVKRAIKLEDPLKISNEIQNKTLRTVASWLSYKVGSPTNSNTDLKFYNLFKKLITLQTNMNRATNYNTRTRIGKEIGSLVGDIIHEFFKLRANLPPGPRGNMGRGFLSGIITQVFGPTVNKIVMGAVHTKMAFERVRHPEWAPKPANWVISI